MTNKFDSRPTHTHTPLDLFVWCARIKQYNEIKSNALSSCTRNSFRKTQHGDPIICGILCFAKSTFCSIASLWNTGTLLFSYKRIFSTWYAYNTYARNIYGMSTIFNLSLIIEYVFRHFSPFPFQVVSMCFDKKKLHVLRLNSYTTINIAIRLNERER